MVIRDYVLKKSNRDYVDKDVMMQIKYRLRGYERIKGELYALKGKSRLTREERRRFRLIESEVALIEESCKQIKARYAEYIDGEFDAVSAYFSYEHYNLHVLRSDDPEDTGAAPGKWSGYKRELTRLLADKFGIV